MVHRGRIIRWIGLTGQVRVRSLAYCTLLFALWVSSGHGQEISLNDSLQIKAYALIYINSEKQVDSITVSKVFCDYCNQRQLRLVKEHARERTINSYKLFPYDKQGVYRNVLFLRYNKAEFRKLRNK